MATCLIAGATGAVGTALARQLDQDGWSLMLLGRNEEGLQRVAATLQQPARVLVCPATDATAVNACIDALPESPAAFAHCIGSTLIRPLHLTGDADLHDLFQVNYFSAFYLLRALVRKAVKQQTPLAAVLTGSTVAMAGFANHEAIAGAKAAVAALAESTAATYADRGIRVNAIMPGLTRSSISQRLLTSPEAEARMAAMNPMRHIGEPNEIAALIAFLLSPAAGWITGQKIGIDGGHAVLHPLPRVGQ